MPLASDKIDTLAQKAAKYIQPRMRGMREPDIRNDLQDYICETLGIEDEDDADAVLHRTFEIVKDNTGQRGSRSTGPGPRTRQREPRQPLNRDLVSAPFRFVALNQKVVPAEDSVREAAYDRPLRDGYSGEIDLSLAFETPMLIGDESEENNHPVVVPLRLGANGPYVVPGASLRGWLRTAMEIVCRARLSQVNKHHRYGVRDFDHPLFAEDATGQRRLAWNKVGAGWLRKAAVGDPEKKDGDSDYVITPCRKQVIRIRSLPSRLNGGSTTNNGDWHLDWLTTKLPQRYEKAGCRSGGTASRPLLDFSDATKRTYIKTATSVKPTDPMRDDYVIEASDAGSAEGWLVFSDRLGTIPDPERLTREEKRLSKQKQDELIRERRADLTAKLDAQDAADPGEPGYYKKREYVFLDDAAAKPVRLKLDVFERFELINSKPSKTKRLPDGSWAVMWPTLKDGRRIPIFFTGDLTSQDKDFDIGLTRLFKLAHKNSVGNVLARSTAHKLAPGRPDMVTALFGHVLDNDDYGLPKDAGLPAMDLQRKGRIAVSFFTLDAATPGQRSEPVEGVAMGPRASFAPYYLAGPIKDWTDEGATPATSGKARLAGRKLYFPHFPSADVSGARVKIFETIRSRKGNQGEQMTRQRFLAPVAPAREVVFNGCIRLHNVTAAEIGALLWALTHGGDPAKPYRHMIGRAKTAGAGQMRVKSINLRVAPHIPPQEPPAPPADWEKPGNNQEGWVSAGSLSMGPFLRAFEKHMRKTDKEWPAVDEIQEFLGACDPIEGKRLVDDSHAEYRAVDEFKSIRNPVKADVRKLDPNGVPDRLLAAPKVAPDRIQRLPYRER